MKNNWGEVKLGECVDFISRGISPTYVEKSNIRVLNQKAIRWGHVEEEYLKYHDKNIKVRENVYIRRRDIVINSTGDITIGRAFYFKEEVNNIFVDSHVTIIRTNKNILIPEFLIYLFPTKKYQSLIYSLVTGATGQLELSVNNLKRLPIILPPLPIQRKIADILSAYDDLIEINEKRIKISEETARLIYKEWFVKFKFPGHEKVKMIKSDGSVSLTTRLGIIPEGWEIKKVGDIVERISSGKQYDSNTVKKSGKVPVLDQGRSGIIGYHDDKPGVQASEDNPVIVFANHTCYQNIILFPFSAIQNVLPFIPCKTNVRNIFWLHWATKDIVKFNDYKGHWPEFINKKLTMPSSSICEEFGKLIKPMVIQVYKLQQQNSILRKTRDMLLPKLISGEVEV